MLGWCTWSTLTKGFLTLVLLLIALEFMYGSIETKNWELNISYNTIRLPFSAKDVQNSTNPSLLSSANNSVILGALLKSNTSQLQRQALKNTVNMTHDDTTSPLPNSSISDALTPSVAINTPPTKRMRPSSTAKPLSSSSSSTTVRPYCPEDPPLLAGRIPVVTNAVPKITDLEKEFFWLRPGGHWRPSTCQPHKAVALIVPFRCRAEHLLIFLKHMHPFLKRQQLDYTIFIVEQNDGGPFNRAMLMNVGFKEALRHRNYDCFIFHDIDLLPEDDRNLYTCPTQPRHMSVAVSTMKYKLPYSRIFGGVSAITREHFELLNGFSNSFWGWGGEDDDMSNRIAYHKLTISRYPFTIARYTMLSHKKDAANPNRYNMLKNGKSKFHTEGLNSLKYTVAEYKQKLLYTWVLATLNKE